MTLTALVARFLGLRLIWADGGYAGKLVTWVATVLPRALVVVKRPRHTRGFQVLQWRWIVERTFGWLNRSRRLSKDFAALPETTETWMRIAMIHVMVRRLAARARPFQTGSERCSISCAHHRDGMSACVDTCRHCLPVESAQPPSLQPIACRVEREAVHHDGRAAG